MVEHEIARFDQAQFQRKLTSSMARMSSILDTLPDAVLVIDRQYRFLMCNDHADLLQPRRGVLGRTIEDVLSAELGRQLTCNIDQAFSSNEVIHHQSRADYCGEHQCRTVQKE